MDGCAPDFIAVAEGARLAKFRPGCAFCDSAMRVGMLLSILGLDAIRQIIYVQIPAQGVTAGQGVVAHAG